MQLTAEQFWEATPKELAALSQVRQDRLDSEAERWAISAAMYAEAHRDPKKRSDPFTADYFLGRKPRPLTYAERIRRSRELGPKAHAIMAGFRGRVNGTDAHERSE